MEYTSRKERKEKTVNTGREVSSDAVKKADEEIFKEQKKRLRRQLNSVSTFAIDENDMKVSPNSLQTRTEVKKQKKIDEILRDIAVLPENEYLNEDTNLRLLKKMSVAKKYNRLQLSPEQEEKMEENKEKFETITNQLWFLIRELEKGKVPEPEIGTIPMMTSKEVSRNRTLFDVEQAKTAEYKVGAHTQTNITDADFEMTSMNTKIDLLEEKLEKISLKNDELEEVLQDLEKVVQEGKTIVNEEVEIQAYNIGEAPEDTLELLEYLEKLEELNKTKSLQLDENRRKVEEMEQTSTQPTPKVEQTEPKQPSVQPEVIKPAPEIKTAVATDVKPVEEKNEIQEEVRKKPKVNEKTIPIMQMGEQPQAQTINLDLTQPVKTVDAPTAAQSTPDTSNNAPKTEPTPKVETPKVEAQPKSTTPTTVTEKTETKPIAETNQAKISVNDTEPTTKPADAVVSETKQPMQTATTTATQSTESVAPATTEAHVQENGQKLKKKNNGLQTSIIILSVIFVCLILTLIVMVIYLRGQGLINF